MMTKFHAQLAEHITPFDDAMRMPDAAGMISNTARGLGGFEAMITQQAAVMAYSNDFLIMTFVSLSAFPLLTLIRSAKSATAAAAASGEGRGACGGDGWRGAFSLNIAGRKEQRVEARAAICRNQVRSRSSSQPRTNR
jgi:hypothetical protein